MKSVINTTVKVSILAFALFLICSGTPSVDAALTGMVTGLVVDSEGEPLKDVVVFLRSLDGSNPNRKAETNKKGKYRLTNVIPGKYVIVATLDGYQHKNTQVIRVSSNGTSKVSLYLELKESQTETTETVEESGEKEVNNVEEADSDRAMDTSDNTAVERSDNRDTAGSIQQN